jgi:serine/threonine-protein kinase RsbW
MTLAPSDPWGDRAEFPARLAMLPATAAFAHDFCVRHGIGRDDALKLTLVIEELFSNTVRHGYGDDSDEPIRIELAAAQGEVSVLYQDRAPPFDPLPQWAAPPAGLDESVETRPVGGLGVHLLGQLVADARYAYEEGSNRLWLTLARGG